tara:strand:+ start:1084 stop:1275 length:192 start_codon:yes stop_codon:yes gene_type:complete
MDEHEHQRIKNKVEDIEKLYLPIIKELNKAMNKAKKLGLLGLVIGGTSLVVSGYLTLRLWDKW